MEILGKLGSALEGFWWSLDEHERQLMLVGVWMLLALALGLSADKRRLMERERLVVDLADELEARRRG